MVFFVKASGARVAVNPALVRFVLGTEGGTSLYFDEEHHIKITATFEEATSGLEADLRK